MLVTNGLELALTAVNAVAISLCWFIAWQRVADKLMETVTPKKRFWGYIAVSVALQVFFNLFALTETGYTLLVINMSYNLFSILNFTLQGFIMWAFMYRHAQLTRAISAIALAYFFLFATTTSVQALTNSALYNYILNDTFTYTQQFVLFQSLIVAQHIIALLLSFALVKLLDKTRFAAYYGNLFAKPVRGWVLCIISFLLMHAYDFALWVHPEFEYSYFFFYSAVFVDALVLLTILIFSVFESNREKVKVQEAFIAQQQVYVQTLEGLQQDLRAFRHDYQNLLSGLYLQAREGDTEALRETLQGTMRYFDDRIGGQIKRVTELSRIALPEVKSLLLVKLVRAEDMRVPMELEIPAELNRVDMNLNDFNRCLGVLVDNALEAAAETPGAAVRVALLQGEKELCVVVANPTPEKPDLYALNRNGFSTKGEGRGTGLANYATITARYLNVAAATSWQEGILRQEMRIRRPV